MDDSQCDRICELCVIAVYSREVPIVWVEEDEEAVVAAVARQETQAQNTAGSIVNLSRPPAKDS